MSYSYISHITHTFICGTSLEQGLFDICEWRVALSVEKSFNVTVFNRISGRSDCADTKVEALDQTVWILRLICSYNVRVCLNAFYSSDIHSF